MEVTLSKPTNLERKSAPPLPAMGTGFRAFNATDRFPPNPIGTSNMMMGRAPVKSCFFSTLSSKSGKGTCRYYYNRRNVPSRGPLRRGSQRSCTRTPPRPPEPRTCVLLPIEGLSDGSQRSNHSRHDVYYNIQACVFTNQYQTMYMR